jgi:hypothetical protein
MHSYSLSCHHVYSMFIVMQDGMVKRDSIVVGDLSLRIWRQNDIFKIYVRRIKMNVRRDPTVVRASLT